MSFIVRFDQTAIQNDSEILVYVLQPNYFRSDYSLHLSIV